MHSIQIEITDIHSQEALQLLDELSKTLEAITGSSGRGSFSFTDMEHPQACFVVARSADGQPIGCGAIRPLSETIAELKRMYARQGQHGTGSAILQFLEKQAQILGFHTLWLETRRINSVAVQFYKARGFVEIPNYGTYIGNPAAVCMAKELTQV